MSKTYTQEQVDAIINERMGRREAQFERMIKDMGFESVDQVREIKTNYDTVVGERDQFKNDYDKLVGEANLNNKRQEITKLGVDEIFVDYVINAVGDGDINEFIEANPKFKAENFNAVNSNKPIGGVNNTDEINKMRKLVGIPEK